MMLRTVIVCSALFILISEILVEGQVSFGFPALGNNNGGFGVSLGGQPQNGRQSVGGLVNSFLGGLIGNQNQGNNQNHGHNNQPHNQFSRPNTQPNNFGFGGFNFGGGGFNPCRNNGGCEHNCEPIGRRRRCRCNDGYVLRNDFRTCIDVDECHLHTHNCQGFCTNTPGSFKCSCRGGQSILLPDLRSCGSKPGGGGAGGGNGGGNGGGSGGGVPPPAIASCSINNGGCEERCTERRGRVRCRCSRGFHLGADKKSCDDVDECATGESRCGPNTCLNTPGSYTCQRGPPVPVESCDVDNGGCRQICDTNIHGQVVCSCRRNFKLRDDGVSCQSSTNPCSRNNGRCQHECVFEHNEKKCKCRNGFELINGRRCRQVQQPVDPCQEGNGGCQHTCTSASGTVECKCQRGYELLNGKLCQLIVVDPCAGVVCAHKCRIVRGHAECYCKHDYYLDNGECIKEDSPFTLPVQPPTPPKPPPSPPRPQPPPSPPKPPLPSQPIFDSCGVNPAKSLIRRIVGGKPADPKDWPWMAALLKRSATASFCGGVLIAPQFVLTAAHCLFQFTKSEIKVRLGEYDFDDKDASSTSLDMNVNEIRMHEKYDSQTQQNDIALIKLDSPIQFNEHIFPVCLPQVDQEYAGRRGYVVGWGTIYFGGPVSNTLQEVIIPVWEDAKCKSAYEGKIHPGMMCAGVPEGGRDSCQGDSGGPYMMQMFPSPKWIVAGVVSWGIECASPNRPGVYTRVNKYLTWIASHSS